MNTCDKCSGTGRQYGRFERQADGTWQYVPVPSPCFVCRGKGWVKGDPRDRQTNY